MIKSFYCIECTCIRDIKFLNTEFYVKTKQEKKGGISYDYTRRDTLYMGRIQSNG